MTPKEHLLELLKAQDQIRRAWAEFSGTSLEKELREIDRELTKVINQLGKMYKQ